LYSSSVFWLTAIACLAAGAVAAWFLRQLIDPAQQRQRELERRLQEAEASLRDYKSQVTEHFRGTAERVNRLTDDYRELHQHLSEGALELCDSREPGQLPPLLTSLGGSGARHVGATTVTPPLDYAPKRSPQQPGMLTEDYDLDRVNGA
jgi:uncharacterized protein